MSLGNSQGVKILREVKSLDREALEMLHDRYYPLLYRYVYFRLGEMQSSDEITRQVFADLISLLGARKGLRKKLITWLFNRAKDLVEERIHSPTTGSAQSLVAHITSQPITRQDSAPMPEEYQQILYVRPAISVLSTQEQHYLALRFTQTFSSGEIADVMGISLRAVRSLRVQVMTSFGQAYSRFA